MVGADRFTERARGVPFGTRDYAPLFSGVEARIERLRAFPLARSVVHGMVDFVPEAERRRLPPTPRQTGCVGK